VKYRLGIIEICRGNLNGFCFLCGTVRLTVGKKVLKVTLLKLVKVWSFRHCCMAAKHGPVQRKEAVEM